MLIAGNRGQRDSERRGKVDWKRALGVERLGLRRRRSRAERELVERLRKLGLVHRPFSIEPISGGLSNRNFAVRTGGKCYFVRMCQELPFLGIDRRNEIVCHQAAGLRGLAPEIIYHERGLLITRFIDGRTLDPSALHEPSMLARVAAVLSPPARRVGPSHWRGALFLRVPDGAHLCADGGAARGCTCRTISSEFLKISRRYRAGSLRFGLCFAITT